MLLVYWGTSFNQRAGPDALPRPIQLADSANCLIQENTRKCRQRHHNLYRRASSCGRPSDPLMRRDLSLLLYAYWIALC